ncbi:MAG TPA: hypothetical protein DCY10_06155 [Clostridiales bacterium]|nr:hypothetical protein [Clostridiales bacterium]
MKGLFRSAVTLSFITIVCIIISLILSAMRKIYIQSWLVLNPSILIGFLTGLVLTSLISLANVFHLQRSHARDLTAALAAFQTESDSFRHLILQIRDARGMLTVSDQNHQALALALARLNECACKIMHCDKVSPLKSATIQKNRLFASAFAKTEVAFHQAFSAFAAYCEAAYHAHSLLPYLKNEEEKQETLRAFEKSLILVYEALEPGSALDTAFETYRTKIDRFLDIRQPKTSGVTSAA